VATATFLRVQLHCCPTAKAIGSGASFANMITLEDCIGFCGLTEEEVLAIAEHEHLPEIAATALAQYLLSQEPAAKGFAI
jgi:hypothetical protein